MEKGKKKEWKKITRTNTNINLNLEALKSISERKVFHRIKNKSIIAITVVIHVSAVKEMMINNYLPPKKKKKNNLR
jgi:uncharacterized membrane protein